MSKRTIVAMCLLPALGAAAHAQYVGKVGQANLAQKPVLRATSVYQYTGSMTKPNASRLVPVVVWDGTSFQPGGLYLARPEPLAVAPGTQYVLTPDGVPAGLFDVVSSAQLNGAWVGLGRYAKETPPLPPKLRAARTLPVLHGGAGHGRADDTDAAGGPVLHRHAGSEGGSTGNGGAATSGGTSKTDSGSSSQSGSGNEPTLHRRDSSGAATSTSSTSTASAPAPDPDRPTLHKRDDTATQAEAPPLDPDRPVLHERHEASAATEDTAPDPNRPHLRYGSGTDSGPVLPAELKIATGAATGAPVKIEQVVAISDVASDEPHSFAYAWPSPQAEADAEKQVHSLALQALAKAVSASFGPAAAADREVRDAAAAENAGFGPAARAGRRSSAHTARTQPTTATDPLLDPEFHAFTLSYGGGSAWVYSAHTRVAGAQRRYVTVIAQPDFSGKAQTLFVQTTRGDMLNETPALHLIDAVDADGDHRAELLFAQQTAGTEQDAMARQFALFRLVGGEAHEVYATGPSARQ